ncbi:MAG: hypothetical protein KAZ88_02825 [Acidimicrobiia bacterium]|jgi:hypothetical protein|nr:hypothetical protein [Acidimicrobiia bacterium]MBP8179907.1 hypothetical protein [Acidimicrobiia bacterium]
MRRSVQLIIAAIGTFLANLATLPGVASARSSVLIDATHDGDLAFVVFVAVCVILWGSLFIVDRVRNRDDD